MVDLDSMILDIIKDSSEDMTVGQVLQAINDAGVKCTYDRAFDRLMSLTSHRSLETVKVKQDRGGYKRVFRLVA